MTRWIVTRAQMAGKQSVISLAHVDCASLLDVSNVVNTISPFDIEKFTDTHLHINQKHDHQHAVFVQADSSVITSECHEQHYVTRPIMCKFDSLREFYITKVFINRRWNFILFCEF